MSPTSRWISASLAFLILACSAPQTKTLTKSERARFYIEIAGAALNEGDTVGALQHLVSAEELDPAIPELYHVKALAFHAKGEDNRAIQEVRRAVKLNPSFSSANTTLGKLLLDQGKFAEAAPFLNKAASDPLNRESYKALTNLGILHYRKKEYVKAREFLNKATQASQLEACIAYYYKGHLDLRESRFKDAIVNYHTASNRLCARFAEAHLALAMTYEKSGQHDLARRKFLEIEQQFHSTQYAQQAIDHLKNLP